MKKGFIAIIAIVVVVIVAAISIAGSYNGFVDKQEAVKTAQSTISVQLQRRADLIPNFVETVKGYSKYEQSTFTAVTEARSNSQSFTPESMLLIIPLYYFVKGKFLC